MCNSKKTQDRSEPTTLSNIDKVSTYLTERYFLKTRLRLYGAMALLIGISLLIGLFAAISMGSSVDLTGIPIGFVVVALIIAFGVKILWSPSPLTMQIAAAITFVTGVLGAVMYVRYMLSTSESDMVIFIFGGLAIMIMLSSSFKLLQDYRRIKEVFKHKPDVSTEQELSVIQRDLLSASKAKKTIPYIHFAMASVHATIKWIGRLHGDIACFLTLNDIPGCSLLVVPRNKVSVLESNPDIGGKTASVKLKIGDFEMFMQKVKIAELNFIESWCESVKKAQQV